jgi:hypothetical protein
MAAERRCIPGCRQWLPLGPAFPRKWVEAFCLGLLHLRPRGIHEYWHVWWSVVAPRDTRPVAPSTEEFP